MKSQKTKIIALALSSLLAVASCQTTVGVGGISNGTAVGVSTSLGNASTGTFMTRNLMQAVPDGTERGRFEILQKAGAGGSDYWCAAGQYVIEGRLLNPSTRIYLEQPLGQGKMGFGKSIGFTILPDAKMQATAAAQENGLSLSTKRVGENWTAAHVNSQCPSVRFGFFF